MTWFGQVVLEVNYFDEIIITASVFICLIFGTILSLPVVWNVLFPRQDTDGTQKPITTIVYLKAGEYGETELDNNWSVFKEPLNAWSSLFFSFFGLITLFTGTKDYLNSNDSTFALATVPIFSIAFGVCSTYLGVASFLFHASHSETWRKADAGMTNGVILPLVAFGIWDHLRPPAMASGVLLSISLLVLLSFTHGYLPYGSSDVLLPFLVAFMWIVELYSMTMDPATPAESYVLFIKCMIVTFGALLLRATDLKRNTPNVKANLLVIYFVLVVLLGYLVGVGNIDVIGGLIAGAIVSFYPFRGHIFWHLGASYSLFLWWRLLSLKRVDPSLSYDTDSSYVCTLVLFIAVKNACRRLYMNIPTVTTSTSLLNIKVKQRLFILLEHLIFTVWGYYVIVWLPDADKGDDPSHTPSSSWLRRSVLCWLPPILPSDAFHLYYLAKVGNHCEDVLYMLILYLLERGSPVSATSTASSSESDIESDKGEGVAAAASPAAAESNMVGVTNEPIYRNKEMVIHHLITAALCVSSYFSGYLKIGSLVMLLHDISDIPLAILMICFNLKFWYFVQLAVFLVSLGTWIYWRLWIFLTVVLWSVVYESKSLYFSVHAPSCPVRHCSWTEAPERLPFFLLLGSLFLLHIFWLQQLVAKGVAESAATWRKKKDISK